MSDTQKSVKSRAFGRIFIVEHPEAEGKALMLEYEVDCPDCGHHTHRIAGHHLRTLLIVVAQAIADHPDLVGEEAGIEIVNRMKFSGTPPRDPSRN